MKLGVAKTESKLGTVIALGLGLLVACPAEAAPKGAVQVPITKVGRVTCGYTAEAWSAGRTYKGGFFLSHSIGAQQAALDARKARGEARHKLLLKSRDLKGRAKREQKVCTTASLPTPTLTPTSTPLPGYPTLTPTIPQGSGAAVRFNLSGAKALALGSAAGVSSFSDADGFRTSAVGSSNMRKMNALGVLEEVVSSGSVSISRFYIGTNGKIYAVLSQQTNLETGAWDMNGCLLVELDPDSPVPTCLDYSLNSVQWTNREIAPPIQFDKLGRVYYLGMRYPTGGGIPMTLLRRYDSSLPENQRITDLVTQNITVQSYFVDPEGYVLISGYTSNPNAYWIREVSPTAQTRNLVTSAYAAWLRLFPDNNIYFGQIPISGSQYGVKRYLTASRTVETPYWIGYNLNYFGNTTEAAWPVNEMDECTGPEAYSHYQPLCSSAASMTQALHRTSSGKVFGIAAWSADGLAMQYYPTVRILNTSVYKAAAMKGVLTNLIISGLSSANENKLVLYDTSDDSELDLFSGTGCSDIDVYRINYSSEDNGILFDGQRFSDSKYVICNMNLDLMQCNCATTGDSKLEDFQAL